MLARITHNWLLKLTALVLSIAVWSHVRGEVNPWETATFKARLQPAIPRGYIVLNPGDIPQNVVVTLRGPRLTLRGLKGPAPTIPLATGDDAPLLSASQLQAALDFSEPRKGEQNVLIKVNANIEDVEVVGAKPNELTIILDAAETRRFSVRPQTPRSEDWQVEEAKSLQETAIVSGPSKSLDRVARVRAAVPRRELKAGAFRVERVPLEAVDSDGDVIKDLPVEPAFTSVEVRVSERQQEKSVPLVVQTVGAAATKFELKKTEAVPPRITIRGPRRVLESIGSLPARVDVEGISGTVTRRAAIDLPETVQSPDRQRVRVRVEVQPASAPTGAAPAGGNSSTLEAPTPSATPALPPPADASGE